MEKRQNGTGELEIKKREIKGRKEKRLSRTD